jgi:hypothetical protein
MIYEDPDELGYWSYDETGMSRAPDRAFDQRSMTICEAILPDDERRAILGAAINAHEGHGLAAENFRIEGGYGRLASRPDADG